MKKLRVLALMDETLVPPDSIEGLTDEEMLDWKTEYDVVTTLLEMGHDVTKLGASDNISLISDTVAELKPDITFNLLEEFHGVATYDQHVAAYLELIKQPYTGCNPEGLLLSHNKVLSKKILQFHGIPTPRFLVYERGKSINLDHDLNYPLFVKSATEDASFGLTVNSLVRDRDALQERVHFFHDEIHTDALVEEFIEGRELYVGVLGNSRLRVLPIWELLFTKLPEDVPNIATVQVKWDFRHQKELGVKTEEAKDLPRATKSKIVRLCKHIYQVLSLSGYARIDLRMNDKGEVFVLEANPNPNLSYGEDLAESADAAGIEYSQLIQRILNLGLRYKPPWRALQELHH